MEHVLDAIIWSQICKYISSVWREGLSSPYSAVNDENIFINTVDR